MCSFVEVYLYFGWNPPVHIQKRSIKLQPNNITQPNIASGSEWHGFGGTLVEIVYPINSNRSLPNAVHPDYSLQAAEPLD